MSMSAIAARVAAALLTSEKGRKGDMLPIE